MTTDIPQRLVDALADRYRIERALGVGGMATVYLAHDLRHDRKVAVKVLKPELAAVLGAERFIVEIRTTASLQHPHILPLFDSGTADGFLFYVMPFIDGETLRSRLDRESQLDVAVAVKIASEIADALDYAHRHGVIHRDIKPENILLHDGRPMVADFGIALALSAAAGGRMTETGLSLGTPHYMSPEQATAEKEITARADIYSLASVLYEMLAGEPPHTGGSAQQIIMKIIVEPAQAVTKLRRSVPPNVADALSKALEKLPADRFDSARAFAAAIHDPAFRVATSAADDRRSAPLWSARSAIGVAVGVVALAAVAAWGWLRPQPAMPVVRYELNQPTILSLTFEPPVPTPAPDGSFIVYHGPIPGERVSWQLWIKRRDQVDAQPIAGTRDVQAFALSPDGAWIAFANGTQLQKVLLAGGPPVTLVERDVYGDGGLAWLDGGTIVLSRISDGRINLLQVSSEGGEPTVVVLGETSAASVSPEAIHGHRALLFNRCLSIIRCDLWAMTLDSDSAQLVLANVSWAQYATTGHIVYEQGGRLLAMAFSPTTLRVTGEPIPLADNISPAAWPIRLSRGGTLISRISGGSREKTGRQFGLVWVDRSGQVSAVDSSLQFSITQAGNNHGWALSPDGSRLAIGLFTAEGDDIWIKQLPRGPLSRLTTNRSSEFRPRWLPDGRTVTYVTDRPDAPGLYVRSANGTGTDSLVVGGFVDEAVYSPDLSWIVLRDGSNGSVRGGRDISGVRTGPDTTRIPLVVTRFDEEAVALSPDGRWLAYQSDETGRHEVYVRTFPDVGGFKHQISTGGSYAPLWSRDGRELFFLSEDRWMMSARITAGSPAQIGDPTRLFRVPDDLLQLEYTYYTPWDVAPDGRFIMVQMVPVDSTNRPRVIVAENWFTEFLARVKR